MNHPYYITMPGDLILIKHHLLLFPIDEQIQIINFEID